MFVVEQLIDFFQFILIGIMIAIIFDFFRAYRKWKKVSTIGVILQDIVYFMIATIIVVLAVIYILDSSIRLHIFGAMLLGFLIYLSMLSTHIIQLYLLFFDTFHLVLEAFLLPFKLLLQVLQKICNIFKNIIKKCCKKFSYMVSFLHKIEKKIKSFFEILFQHKKMKKQKRVIGYGESLKKRFTSSKN